MENGSYLLDEIDLFANSTTPSTEISKNYSMNRSIRMNSLIDTPVPELLSTTEKLIDWSDSNPTTTSTTTTNSIFNDTNRRQRSSNFIIDPRTKTPQSSKNFVADEQWPEVPTINLEHRVSSTSGSTSSQKDLLVPATIRPIPPPPSSNGIAKFNHHHGSKDLFRCDSAPESCQDLFLFEPSPSPSSSNKPSNLALLTGVVPPKIEQRKPSTSLLNSAPPIVNVSNGFAAFNNYDYDQRDLHVDEDNDETESSIGARYQRFSSSTSAKSHQSNLLSNGGKDHRFAAADDDKFEDEDGEEDDDEVFLRIGGGSMAPLTGGSRKKKVRFFEDGITTESELLVGSAPPSSSSGGSSSAVSTRKGRSWRPRLIPLLLVAAILLALAATVIVIIYAPWKKSSTKSSSSSSKVPPELRRTPGAICSDLRIEYVGNFSLDNAYPTSAMTKFCSNGGGGRDEDDPECKLILVVGYGSTDAVPCYGGSSDCHGGVAAFDASTMNLIWRCPSFGEITGLNCRDDLNGDGANDCLVSGKHGVLMALNGKTGEIVWEVGKGQREVEYFTPQIVPDMDNDGVPEVLATKVDRIEDYMRLCVLSGKTGHAYVKHTTSTGLLTLNNMETVVPSTLWRHGESLPDVVITAGSFNRRGGIYNYELQSILLGRFDKGRLIYNGSVLSPPTFADLNGDSFSDMIVCTIAGELIAIDGANVGNVLWMYKAMRGQCASPLVVGFFNSDSYPDIAVGFCFGDGFPTYRYCETIFIDGRTGSEMNGSNRVHSLLPSTTAGLSIRTNSGAGDVFLVWNTTCGGSETDVNYRFVDAAPNGWRGFGWSNICMQLFGRRATHQLLAVGGGLRSPKVVFDTSVRDFEEELEKFAAALEQSELGLNYYMGKRKVALVQLGPAGTFVTSRTDGVISANLILPTYVSIASPLNVVPVDCSATDDPRLCSNQYDRLLTQQASNRATAPDFSGGFLLHKLRLSCTCEAKPCAQIVAGNRYQTWSEYLGSQSNGRFEVSNRS